MNQEEKELRELRISKALEMLAEGKFTRRFTYIHGEPGSGKTRLANRISEKEIEQAKHIHGVQKTAICTNINEVNFYYELEDICILAESIPTEENNKWSDILQQSEMQRLYGKEYYSPFIAEHVIICGLQEPNEFFDTLEQTHKHLPGIEQLIASIKSTMTVYNLDNESNPRVKIK